MNNSEIKLVYDMLLSAPGMKDTVKLNIGLKRETILLLCQVIEKGIKIKGSNELSDFLPKGNLEELQHLSENCLEKSGLTEMWENLKIFQSNDT